MRKNLDSLIILLLITFVGCNTNDNVADDVGAMTDDEISEPMLEVVNAFPQLSFSRPVDLQSPDDTTNRIFVVEQKGVISVFANDAAISEAGLFLDIEDSVFDGASEMGLLGLAFHQEYATNGFFYVYYTPTSRLSRISRFQVSPTDADLALSDSELVILEFAQPFTNHNGGQLAFGPDGYLYISSGDGGDGGDPMGHGQDLSSLLGTILRIDVNTMANGLNYAIPTDNPFVGQAEARAEIYAYGLRNPWRMSFDKATGLLWTADVGQGKWEEIDLIENGKNYGWNILEGSNCFGTNTCDKSNLTPPVFEYNHDNGDLSITGGYVYRGERLPQISDKYIYGDYLSGRIWALDADTSTTVTNELLFDTNLEIASFGTDASGEIYICAFDGAIYKFEAM